MGEVIRLVRKSNTETGIALWRLKVQKHAQLAAEMDDLAYFTDWLRNFADELEAQREA